MSEGQEQAASERKRRVVLLLWCCMAVMLACSGCKKAPSGKKDVPKVLAKVNGVPISMDDVYVRLGGHEQYLGTKHAQQALDDIIDDELLYQKGVQLGLDRDEKYRSAVRLMELRIAAFKRAEMARRVRNSEVAAKVNVTEQDARDYYTGHEEEISTALHLMVLSFRDPIAAEDALGRLRSGTTMEQIAAEREGRRSMQRVPDGDWGYLPWQRIPTEWLGTVYTMRPGEISPVLSGRSGIHIVKLIDRKEDKQVPYGKVSVSIMNRLNQIRTEQAYQDLLASLKKTARIQRFKERRE